MFTFLYKYLLLRGDQSRRLDQVSWRQLLSARGYRFNPNLKHQPGICLAPPFSILGTSTGSPREGSSLDKSLGHAFHQGRSSGRWREVHQRQGGQGIGEQRILKEPMALVNRYKWCSYGFNHFPLTISLSHSPLFILQISHPSSSPPLSPPPQLSAYMTYFVTTQSLLWGWVCVNVDQYVEVCCTLSTPLLPVLIVHTSILATMTPHCDSWRVQGLWAFDHCLYLPHFGVPWASIILEMFLIEC